MIVVRSLGEDGLWPTLFAAVREEDAGAAYLNALIDTARQTCFENLVGVLPVVAEAMQ